jgi:hypothetical protein
MILKFPDLATLQLALTSSTVPADLWQAPAKAGFGDGAQVWVEPEAAPSRAVQTALKKLGVEIPRKAGVELTTPVRSWLELLPLQPAGDVLEGLDQTPVLFDMADGTAMARLAGEMLRLGNDRQGFRWLQEHDEENGRALLRVVGPPYYSLLRALDRRGKPDAPVAFVERAPGVWIEVGQTHALAEKIRPPKNRLLLLRPPREWTVLEDAPFRDVYEVLEFHAPDAATSWQERNLTNRLQVRLALRPGGSPDNPELWVLKGDDPVAELNRFVQNNDDQMLARLAFAVGENGGKKTIVVRVRQSKQPPPHLVLNAIGYRHHLKLQNLFLPVGMGLHPPLRRDKVRELFADDVNQVTWLAPADGGVFTPQSMPEDAFRPLTDWVDYVLDHDREALQAWVQAAQFDFESFVCNEDGTPKKKAEPPEPKKPSRPRERKSQEEREARFEAAKPEEEETEAEPELDAFGDVEVVEPSEAEKELRILERQFLDLEGGLDLPERRALWPRLAQCNSAIRSEDAGICWLSALWWEKKTPAKWAWQWFNAEVNASVSRFDTGPRAAKSWLVRLIAEPGRREVTAADLDRLLATREPAIAELRALSAYIVWAGGTDKPPAVLLERLQQVQSYLEAHERLLPVRSVWLAWYHLAHLASGDVLALARARDRLLERLFRSGLKPEQDLPKFLRSSGQSGPQRFRALGEWMVELSKLGHKWAKDNADPQSNAATEAYVDLIFSFGLARLGEADASQELADRARKALAEEDEVHNLLLEIFEYRINQALQGNPHTGPLPQVLLDKQKTLKDNGAYIVDRLRRHSRIIDPEQRIDPYRRRLAHTRELDRQLAELDDMRDRNELASRLRKLLHHYPKESDVLTRAQVLRVGLDVAPRVGEEFAQEMLAQVVPVNDALPEPQDPNQLEERGRLLERALFTAGHFDRIDSIHPLVGRFQRLLQTQHGGAAADALAALAGQCFRGLRKLGMKDEIDRLLTQMAELVLEGRDLGRVDAAGMAALLLVAGEWYFFGRDVQAEPVLQAARTMLLREELDQREEYKSIRPRLRNKLAVAYARAVGQAPVPVAQKRLEELFRSVKWILDSFTSSKYFSVAQLDVVEAVVLAVVSDDFTTGAQGRRWLDEDEFLVRRRIHADVKTMKSQG